MHTEQSQARAPLALVYIGRIAREAGIIDVVHGLWRARAAGIDTTLVIAGSGEDEYFLRRLVERLDLRSCVQFRAPVYGEARLRLLAGADLSILPCSGTGLLETLYYSLFAGVPVIARRAGAASDAVVDRVQGLLLPAHEPDAYGRVFRELDADRSLLERLRRSCRAHGALAA
jgi:glycosyltransferase involved in cell wall biosynthesis